MTKPPTGSGGRLPRRLEDVQRGAARLSTEALQQMAGDWAMAAFPGSTTADWLNDLEQTIAEIGWSVEPQAVGLAVVYLMILAHRGGFALFPQAVQAYLDWEIEAVEQAGLEEGPGGSGPNIPARDKHSAEGGQGQ